MLLPKRARLLAAAHAHTHQATAQQCFSCCHCSVTEKDTSLTPAASLHRPHTHLRCPQGTGNATHALPLSEHVPARTTQHQSCTAACSKTMCACLASPMQSRPNPLHTAAARHHAACCCTRTARATPRPRAASGGGRSSRLMLRLLHPAAGVAAVAADTVAQLPQPPRRAAADAAAPVAAAPAQYCWPAR